jgi:hypothetical protein
MIREEITFSLKGSREYVQGTSIFESVIQLLHKDGIGEGKIDISFKKMTLNTHCIIEQRSPTPEDHAIAKITLKNNDIFCLCLTGASLQGARQRVSYDEDAICKNSVIHNASISKIIQPPVNEIEELIALCKHLHLARLSHDKKWVFSRYVGKFPLDIRDDVSIIIRKTIGTKLTCSEAYSHSEKIGDIYFS